MSIVNSSLRSLCVIGVFALVGPAQAAPASTIWSIEAEEGQSFSTAERQFVRFGLGNSWVEKVAEGTVECTGEAFGSDPAPGSIKRCDSGWIEVSGEYDEFTLPSAGTVRFGMGSNWISRDNVKDGACTNEFFGEDPARGDFKTCQTAAIDGGSEEPDSPVGGGGEEPDGAVNSGQIEFRNLMVIYQGAARDGQTWTFSQEAVDAHREAFLNTWPAQIYELTGGRVKMVNTVKVTDHVINQFEDGTGPPPSRDGLGNWQQQVGETGDFDVVYIANPAPQDAMWAYGICCDDTQVGWTFVPQRSDLGLYEDALAGWTHEWLHVIGEAFYRDRLDLPGIPDLHSGESSEYNYQRDQGGYLHWQKWYADYLNREISVGTELRGLGEAAWSRGTLRDYLLRDGAG